MSFESLGLNKPLLQAIEEKGYTEPSPIQAKAIQAVLTKRDVMAAAQTGTGKTAGFTLPMLQLLDAGEPAKNNQVRALVLTPTRELAAQVADSVETYSKHLNIRSQCVFGGVKINPQMMKLRKGADILVATPGRLLDLYSQNAIKFDNLEMLVLDEADRMLDMGFIHDIKRIFKLLPARRQNLMFSATFSEDIRELAKGLVYKPIEISVSPANSTAKRVEQKLYNVDQGKKGKLLIKLIKQNDWQQVLVFSRTKHGANRIARNLESRNISAAAIHGNKSQGARTKALANFKDKSVRVLVATDIAARGLDISQLPQVVNYDLPQVAEDYVHRIGRTGRAGAEGLAVSLVSGDEFKNLNDIEQLIQQHIPRAEDDEFVPQMPLPTSKAIKPPKKKKPKKNKKALDNKGNGETKAPSQPNQAKRLDKTNKQTGNKKPTSQPRRQKTTNKEKKPEFDWYANTVNASNDDGSKPSTKNKAGKKRRSNPRGHKSRTKKTVLS